MLTKQGKQSSCSTVTATTLILPLRFKVKYKVSYMRQDQKIKVHSQIIDVIIIIVQDASYIPIF